MAGMIRDEDFRIDSGRAAEGRMFLRVVHVPTGVSRVVVGLNGRPSTEVVQELFSAVLQEIESVGWRRPQPRREASAESDAAPDRPRE
jgi:hypothetical protein